MKSSGCETCGLIANGGEVDDWTATKANFTGQLVQLGGAEVTVGGKYRILPVTEEPEIRAMSATAIRRDNPTQPTAAPLSNSKPHSSFGGTPIQKVAVVSHDYTVPDSRGRHDYTEHFARLLAVCDGHGCDTVLFAPWTWDSSSPAPRTHAGIFNGLEHIQQVVLEVGSPNEGGDQVEAWSRESPTPLLAFQRFAASAEPRRSKQQFLDELPLRRVGDALLVLCGETNIASMKRGTGKFDDPFRFVRHLRELNTRVILNPVHDYMRRYEMREKRRFYSRGGKTVISVWNRGKGREAWLPWTLFHDGADRTASVTELDPPFSDRPDIRIGLIDLPTL